jgi:hypothetical protein
MGVPLITAASSIRPDAPMPKQKDQVAILEKAIYVDINIIAQWRIE